MIFITDYLLDKSKLLNIVIFIGGEFVPPSHHLCVRRWLYSTNSHWPDHEIRHMQRCFPSIFCWSVYERCFPCSSRRPWSPSVILSTCREWPWPIGNRTQGHLRSRVGRTKASRTRPVHTRYDTGWVKKTDSTDMIYQP